VAPAVISDRANEEKPKAKFVKAPKKPEAPEVLLLEGVNTGTQLAYLLMPTLGLNTPFK
jgi:hypothetical protein